MITFLLEFLDLNRKGKIASAFTRFVTDDQRFLYWVIAHVTPSTDNDGNVVGYHSSRRVPQRDVLEQTIIPLYRNLLAEEAKFENRKEGMEASFKMVVDILTNAGIGYDEFFFSLQS